MNNLSSIFQNRKFLSHHHLVRVSRSSSVLNLGLGKYENSPGASSAISVKRVLLESQVLRKPCGPSHQTLQNGS